MRKLPNAPLQEVIFEVKWDLSFDTASREMIDPGFNLALGKFHGLVNEDFPKHISKYPSDVPITFFNHKVIHQFWRGDNQWPVVQLGPGVLTVNDTDDNYEWDNNFYPLVKSTLRHLLNSYGSMSFAEYSLRYIDVVRRKDYDSADWPSFFRDNINFEFKNNFEAKGKLKEFQFQQNFEIDSIGDLTINLSNGINNKKEEIFVWQTTIGRKTGIDDAVLLEWLNDAHAHSSQVFKEICKKDFYGSFIK